MYISNNVSKINLYAPDTNLVAVPVETYRDIFTLTDFYINR